MFRLLAFGRRVFSGKNVSSLCVSPQIPSMTIPFSSSFAMNTFSSNRFLRDNSINNRSGNNIQINHYSTFNNNNNNNNQKKKPSTIPFGSRSYSGRVDFGKGAHPPGARGWAFRDGKLKTVAVFRKRAPTSFVGDRSSSLFVDAVRHIAVDLGITVAVEKREWIDLWKRGVTVYSSKKNKHNNRIEDRHGVDRSVSMSSSSTPSSSDDGDSCDDPSATSLNDASSVNRGGYLADRLLILEDTLPIAGVDSSGRIITDDREYEAVNDDKNNKKNNNKNIKVSAGMMNDGANDDYASFSDSPLQGGELARASDIDLAVVLGGDGTLLHVSSLFQESCPPVLAIGAGTIGALMPFTWREARAEIAALAENGACVVSERPRMACFSPRGPRAHTFRTFRALNDMVVYRGTYPHTISVQVTIDGEFLLESTGDGVIVSTALGSTGYSMSAGGPLLHPSVGGVVVTPINSRSLNARSVVVPNSAEIGVHLVKAQGDAVVSIDSLAWARLGTGGEARCSDSGKEPLPVVSRAGGSAWADWLHNVHKHIHPMRG